MLDRPTEPSRIYVLLAALLLFAALGPTLSKPEFARTLENLNIETALEARRDGHWLEPTLEGQPRTKKPPMAAWITGLSMRPGTIADCSSRDPAVRAAAFRALAWQARWPALFQACLALVAVYFLGRPLGVGVASSFMLGSTYLFLRYAQVALTDVPLMLWVITANACFATATFRGYRWTGAIGAGFALGVAFLCKGPVAFVQSLLPWLVWWLWDGRRRTDRARRPLAMPIVVAALVGLAIAAPWYLAVFIKDPHRQYQIWFKEITGSDAPERHYPLLSYFMFLPEFMPALLFAIPAMWRALKTDAADRDRSPLRLMVCLIAVPIVVQTCFKNKLDRYILSLVGPMAVLGAAGLRQLLTLIPSPACGGGLGRGRLSPTNDIRIPDGPLPHPPPQAGEGAMPIAGWIYWIALAAMPIALVVFGAAGWPHALRGVDGRPWFAWPLALAVIAVAVFVFGVAVRYHRGQSARVAAFTCCLMLLFMHLLSLGYFGRSASGRSKMRPLAERIWAQYPDADVFTSKPFGQRASEDLSLYLNRLTGWIKPADMIAAAPGDRPKVVLMKEREITTALPATWHDLMTMPKEEGETWRAVALPKK